MKKQITMRSLFMIVMFSLMSFAGYSQVAVAVKQDSTISNVKRIRSSSDSTNAVSLRMRIRQDTSIANVKRVRSSQDTSNSVQTRVRIRVDTTNAKLALIKTASYSNSVSLTAIDKGIDTLNQALRTNSVTGRYGKISNSGAIVMSVAGAYATGDYMGTSTTPQSFTNCVRSSGGTATIKSITISDKITNTNEVMELWLFSATFTAPTDNGAWSISDAEALTVVGIIPIPVASWYASALNQVFHRNDLNIKIKPGVTSIFYALVARGTTPAFTSGDLMIDIGIDQD